MYTFSSRVEQGPFMVIYAEAIEEILFIPQEVLKKISMAYQNFFVWYSLQCLLHKPLFENPLTC